MFVLYAHGTRVVGGKREREREREGGVGGSGDFYHKKLYLWQSIEGEA
jgi:hypothetical protein